MQTTKNPGEPGQTSDLIDATVAARTNLREGLAAMHRVRLSAYLAFAGVILLTGPVLGIDPIAFTLRGGGICGLGAASAWLVLRAVRGGPPREWMAYVAVPVDVGAVVFVALLLGGIDTTAPLVFFVVVVMHGLLLTETEALTATSAKFLQYDLGPASDPGPPLVAACVMLQTKMEFSKV